MTNKEYIAKRVNENCAKSSCFVCREADKYENYEDCPYLKLKLIARERKVLPEDVSDELAELCDK